MKLQDRKESNNRVFHPDRDANTTKYMAKSAAAMANTSPVAPKQETVSLTSVAPMGQNGQYQWTPYNPAPWTTNQGLYPSVFPPQQVAVANTPMFHNNGEQNQFYQKPTGGDNTMKHLTSAATTEKPESCPFPTCTARILPGPYAQEHFKTYHQLQGIAP